jgi:lipoprotein NlpD
VTVRALVLTGVIVAVVPSIALAATPPRTKARPKPATQPGAPAQKQRSAAKPAADVHTPIIHEVRRGETLSAIAKKYDVTVSSLVIANRLRGPRARLQAGQRLTIPRRPGAGAPTLRLRRGRGPVDEPLPVSLVLSVPDFEDVAPPFQWPIVGPVTSTFGRRNHTWHRGVDIRADSGTPIRASAPGVVIASGFEERYGLRVKIEHDGGFVTLYAHNERNLVDVGDEVTAGQMIALVGRTGRATAEHVHFEIRYDGRVYNPLYLLPMPPRSVQVDSGAPEHEDDE